MYTFLPYVTLPYPFHIQILGVLELIDNLITLERFSTPDNLYLNIYEDGSWIVIIVYFQIKVSYNWPALKNLQGDRVPALPCIPDIRVIA